ncbi:MAG: TerC family protein [Bradyrhizobiaceae bacterium]|nr:TerC family protein [Bradyrhizobiaceae bacterium]
MGPEFWSVALQNSVVQIDQAGFWVAVVEVIWIDILLSGDNAVVIALACRRLPPRQRFWGMMIGAGIASLLLITFTAVVATLMTLPFLKLVGGSALFWVAYKLLLPDTADGTVEAVDTLWRAVRMVVVADIVMSLDNAIAVAAVAKGNYALLGLGLAVSIPVVIAGSALIMRVLQAFPLLVWAGAALLGWVAGSLLATDPVVGRYISADAHFVIDTSYATFGRAGHTTLEFSLNLLEFGCSLLGMIGVVLAGVLALRSRRSAAHAKGRQKGLQ